MAITYQFNRMAIQELRIKLRMRQAALPTLKNKETALRSAVLKKKEELEGLQKHHDERLGLIKADMQMWGEFSPDIFFIKRILTDVTKVAGVPVPQYKDIIWDTREFSKFNRPVWIVSGIRLLKDLAIDEAKMEIVRKDIEILEKARRRTTQKVNLYEKVQIPAFSEAILKIKRALEDVENLEKAAQKLTRARLEASEKVRLSASGEAAS